jgi:hypothetical protein
MLAHLVERRIRLCFALWQSQRAKCFLGSSAAPNRYHVRLLREWHGGTIPADRVLFIAAILDIWLPEHERQLGGVLTVEDWLLAREHAAEHLAMACDCIARDRAASWAN